MSIKFDPNENLTCPLDRNPFVKDERSNAGLFKRLIGSIYEGQRAERLPWPQYCRKTWEEQTSLKPDQASVAFQKYMKSCEASHADFMAFVHVSRIT